MWTADRTGWLEHIMRSSAKPDMTVKPFQQKLFNGLTLPCHGRL